MHYKRISADCHLDMIWLPPDLFTSEASSELKERMPFVNEGPNGKEWVADPTAPRAADDDFGQPSSALVVEASTQ